MKSFGLKTPYWVLMILLAILIPMLAYSQSDVPTTAQTIFQHLQETEVSEITLAANFSELYAKRKEEFETSAVVSWKNKAGEEESMDIQIELRGKNRRRVCDFPPVRLIFDKDELEKRGYSRKGDKLKLVSHCDDQEDSDQFVLKEFWAYRLYNRITPSSFQAHLLHIRYIDTADPGYEERVHIGFFIESEEELAIRLGGEKTELWGTTPEKVSPESYHSTILLEYMIGNDDWDLFMNRNIAFIQTEEKERPLVIPYDFDFAGIVNASYAKPNQTYGASAVTDRVPIGKFDSKEDLEQACDQLLSLRKELVKMHKECPYLTNASKREMTYYLNEFFTFIRNKREMAILFVGED